MSERKRLSVSQQAKQRITDAFWILYEKESIQHIRVQDVCDLAGYHRNSFYRYYSSVYDILDTIEDTIISDIVQNTDDGIVHAPDCETVHRFLAIWEKNRKYLKVFAKEEKGSHFQRKLLRHLKGIHGEKFVYSDNPTLDSFIWEYQLTGAIAVLLLCVSQDNNTLSLEEAMNLLMGFKHTHQFHLRYRNR